MKTLVVGAAVIDMIMVIDKLPESGGDVLCSDNKTLVGGCAYNVASTMKNLQCEHDLCVPVGKGMYADIIKKELDKKGYKLLIEDPSMDNGYCLCLVDAEGERTFITAQGIEGVFKMGWFENIDMNQYDKVYIAGYQAFGEAGKVLVEWLKNLNQQIVFAPGPVICQIDKEVIDAILAMKPIVHLNDKELLDFTKEKTIDEGLKSLNDITDNLVIVTQGADGATYFDGLNIKHIDGVKGEVVDTIGAGDSHIGGVLSGLSQGMSIDSAIKLANQVAALVVGVKGPVINKEDFVEKFGEVKWNE